MTARLGIGKGLGKGYRNILPFDSHVHYLSAKGISITPPVFQKSNMFHLPYELTLYVPSTQGKETPIPAPEFNRRVKEAEDRMGRLFGGFTRVSDYGGYRDDDKHKIIKEDGAMVTSFTTKKSVQEHKKGFESYVRKIQKKYDQDSIGIGYEGDLFYYDMKGDPTQRRK